MFTTCTPVGMSGHRPRLLRCAPPAPGLPPPALRQGRPAARASGCGSPSSGPSASWGLVVEKALAEGHSASALMRDPGRQTKPHPRLQVLSGSPTARDDNACRECPFRESAADRLAMRVPATVAGCTGPIRSSADAGGSASRSRQHPPPGFCLPRPVTGRLPPPPSASATDQGPQPFLPPAAPDPHPGGRHRPQRPPALRRRHRPARSPRPCPAARPRRPAAFRPTTITRADGGRAEILIVPTGLVDCANRRVHASGVSFPAILHRSSLGPLSRPPEQLVLFLRRDRGRWQLTGDGTYVSVSRLGAIRRAIPRPPSAAAPSR
jgi:hypothetical protein